VGKVEHVSADMDSCPYHHGPSGGFVQCETLVEWDDRIERSATEERDEVAADREKDEDDIDMKYEGRGTGDSWPLGLI